MDSAGQNLGLGEAASRFLADLPDEERGSNQQEIFKFARWFGWERPLAGLAAAEVANYAERLSVSDTDYLRKLELVRGFLVYAKRKGWSQTNLAVHLKSKKGKTKLRVSSKRGSSEAIALTQQGYADLEAELVTLKDKRLVAIDEIRKAAADKDFRENVPLHAAREQRSLLEGRILELEETLKSAVVIDEKQEGTLRAGIGVTVILCDLDSGDDCRYTLVSSREVDATKGKISSASPVGRAVMDKGEGEIVEVIAPAGKRRYQIKQVER